MEEKGQEVVVTWTTAAVVGEITLNSLMMRVIPEEIAFQTRGLQWKLR